MSQRDLQLEPGPRLVGIVNITADSFSDGGRFLEPQHAVERAREQMAGGAALVELGPASSHPDAVPVGASQEIARLTPVIDALVREEIPFGVDSFETQTQRFALERGAQQLNDIQGFPDPGFWNELAEGGCDLVVMHSIQGRGAATREDFDDAGILDRVFGFFEDRLTSLENAGVARERIIVDPGMGFFLGARPESSVVVLRAIGRLRRQLRCRVLVSVSRKSFLGAICGDPDRGVLRPVDERLPSTLAAELYAARQGVDWIRTHDVQALSDALRTTLRLEGDAFFAAHRGASDHRVD